MTRLQYKRYTRKKNKWLKRNAKRKLIRRNNYLARHKRDYINFDWLITDISQSFPAMSQEHSEAARKLVAQLL